MTHPAEVGEAGTAGLAFRLTPICVAVRDVHETMAEYRRAFGWSNWKLYEFVEPFHHETRLGGAAVPYSLRTAEVTVGSLRFVLIEPLEGPSPWKKFLESQGEGLVSIGISFPTIEELQTVRREFKKLGIEVIAGARVGNDSEYFCLESREQFGCLIEVDCRHPLDFSETAQLYPEVSSGQPVSAARPNDITQVAVVVRDLDTKMRECHKALGWGPWKLFQCDGETIMHHCTMDGKACDFFRMRWAEVKVGDVIFELVQPLGGDNPWQRMLDANGEGIGSIAVMYKTMEDSAAVKAEFATAGCGVTSSGHIGDHIEWYYLDTQPTFKCVIESGSGHAIEFMDSKSVYPENARLATSE